MSSVAIHVQKVNMHYQENFRNRPVDSRIGWKPPCLYGAAQYGKCDFCVRDWTFFLFSNVSCYDYFIKHKHLSVILPFIHASFYENSRDVIGTAILCDLSYISENLWFLYSVSENPPQYIQTNLDEYQSDLGSCIFYVAMWLHFLYFIST